MKRRHKKINLKLVAILVSLGAVGVLAAIAVVTFYPFKAKEPSSVQISGSKANTTNGAPDTNQDEDTPAPTVVPPSDSPVAPVSKPTFQKSSGNAPGSSVPVKAVIAFTCEGSVGAQCEMVLTDRANASRVINLERNAIVSNGRGQYFATWEWAAIAGSWKVEAKSSRNGLGAVMSDSQNLEVK